MKSLEDLENLDDVKKKTINSANIGQSIRKSKKRGNITQDQWDKYKKVEMTIVDLREIRDKKLCTDKEYEMYEKKRKPIENDRTKRIRAI